MPNKKSFTLIELLIVLIIIGIMATLAVPQYKNWVRRSKAAEAKPILRALSDAAWGYYIETGEFPEFDSIVVFKNMVSGGTEYILPANNSFEIDTKYFRYSYAPGIGGLWGVESYGGWQAAYWDTFSAMSGNPKGTVLFYFTCYVAQAPTGNQQAQKMDDKWYRYYGCVVQAADEYGWEVVFKWD